MARRDVELYFNDYVFGFMESDIQRELTFARTPLGAGNVLAALGLVVYTEVLGRIWTRNLSQVEEQNAPNFNACLARPSPWLAHCRWRLPCFVRGLHGYRDSRQPLGDRLSITAAPPCLDNSATSRQLDGPAERLPTEEER